MCSRVGGRPRCLSLPSFFTPSLLLFLALNAYLTWLDFPGWGTFFFFFFLSFAQPVRELLGTRDLILPSSFFLSAIKKCLCYLYTWLKCSSRSITTDVNTNYSCLYFQFHVGSYRPKFHLYLYMHVYLPEGSYCLELEVLNLKDTFRVT